jgi:hypothetical protein
VENSGTISEAVLMALPSLCLPSFAGEVAPLL